MKWSAQVQFVRAIAFCLPAAQSKSIIGAAYELVDVFNLKLDQIPLN